MTLTLTAMVSLFGAMAVLASVPSVSVVAVVAVSASSGVRNGLCTALGIVAGDVVFILLAIFGLTLLVDALGEWSFLLNGACALYLLWKAWVFWSASSADPAADGVPPANRRSAFTTGLLITLGDQKAVLFYLGFFPAFLSLDTITPLDIGVVILITLFSVGGVKALYAFAADRVRDHLGAATSRWINRLASLILVGASLLILIRIP